LVDTSRSANEAWVSRQALQDVYQKLLVMDLEFALDKKVEQELYVMYHIITHSLQHHYSLPHLSTHSDIMWVTSWIPIFCGLTSLP